MLKRMASVTSSPASSVTPGLKRTGIINRLAKRKARSKDGEQRKIGKKTLKFIRRSSAEILASFGIKDFDEESEPDEDLKVPGMKRSLYVEEVRDSPTQDTDNSTADDNISLLQGQSASRNRPDSTESQSRVASVASSLFGRKDLG